MNWSAYKVLEGKAVECEELLENLAQTSVYFPHYSVRQLKHLLVRDGKLFSAAVPVVERLFNRLPSAAPEEIARNLELIQHLLTCDVWQAYGWGADKRVEALSKPLNAKLAKELHRLVASQLPQILRLLRHDEPRVRAYALGVLCFMPSADQPTVDEVQASLLAETDDGVRLTGSLALGYLLRTSKAKLPVANVLSHGPKNPDLAEGVAVCLDLLQAQNPVLLSEGARDAVARAIAACPSHFALCAGDLDKWVGRLLCARCEDGDRTAADVFGRVLKVQGPKWHRASWLMGEVLKLGMPVHPTVRMTQWNELAGVVFSTFNEWGASEQKWIGLLMESDYGADAEVGKTLVGSRGLPMTRLALRRWLGQDPAGVLEESRSWSMADFPEGEPLFQTIGRMLVEGKKGEVVAALSKNLDVPTVLDVLGVLTTGAYGSRWFDELNERLAAATPGECQKWALAVVESGLSAQGKGVLDKSDCYPIGTALGVLAKTQAVPEAADEAFASEYSDELIESLPVDRRIRCCVYALAPCMKLGARRFKRRLEADNCWTEPERQLSKAGDRLNTWPSKELAQAIVDVLLVIESNPALLQIAQPFRECMWDLTRAAMGHAEVRDVLKDYVRRSSVDFFEHPATREYLEEVGITQ